MGTLKPLLIGGKDSSVMASFLLGWAVTGTAGLMSYPIDTIRRRMMMTSGGGKAYKGSIDCAMQIMKNEGFMSMMKGAGANILRGVAGWFHVINIKKRTRQPPVKERDAHVYGDHHYG